MIGDCEQDLRLGKLIRRAQDGDGSAYRELLLHLIAPRLRSAVLRWARSCSSVALISGLTA